MINDAIANIAKPPGFSTSNAPPVLAIPLWSTTIQSIRTRKKRLRIIAVSRVGRLSRRPALRPDKKAPAASGFWVYFELRLERHPPSTSDPLCVGRPIAF